ncbi:PREDICTED: 21 kDa protein-like [Ipomoea nil]|uniref:21 kDa protein-like n=1 Tax=Ipomoea nil TaxID=35883 RepID=UPI000901D890|nr:PREDICTED: 21 kDa protein-like [Ipomoea nil]
MEKLSFSSFFLLVLLSIFSLIAAGSARPVQRWPYSRARTYVESQCRRTLYPKLCVSGLAGNVNPTSQSPQELAQVALKVSLVRARYASAYMAKVSRDLKPKEYRAAVRDCINQIEGGASQLARAVKELRRLKNFDGENAFVWHQSNVQTWLSTMETNAFACMDGISGYRMGGRVRRVIQAKVLNVAESTSIALAMFNHFAATQRASFSKNKP